MDKHAAKGAVGGLILVAILGFTGCLTMSRQPVNLAMLLPPYRIEVYEKGSPVSERTVPLGSADEMAITAWLQAHESGWRADYQTYAPGRRIQGDGFSLTFSGRVCVLNYDRTGRGDLTQVSRLIEQTDALPKSVFATER